MRIIKSLLGLVPVLGFAAGCDQPVLFSAEIDAPDICISGLRVPFPPSDYHGNTDSPISGQDLGMPDADAFELDVTVRAVGITAVSGVSDLGFLDALTVSAVAADPGSALPELMLVEMDEADHTADGAMYAEPETPANIATHLEAGDVFFRFGLSGQLPDTVWEADVDLCVHAVASYEKPL
jgi:hypothetical protein